MLIGQMPASRGPMGARQMWSFLHLLTTQCFECRLSSNEPCRIAGTESTCVCAPALLHSAWPSWRKPSGVPAVADSPLWRALCMCSHCVRALLYRRCAVQGFACARMHSSVLQAPAPPVWRAEACQTSTWRAALRLTLHCIVAERATGSSRPRFCGRLKCAQRLCLL